MLAPLVGGTARVRWVAGAARCALHTECRRRTSAASPPLYVLCCVPTFVSQKFCMHTRADVMINEHWKIEFSPACDGVWRIQIRRTPHTSYGHAQPTCPALLSHTSGTLCAYFDASMVCWREAARRAPSANMCCRATHHVFSFRAECEF